jgi:hypothetical protein
MSIEQEAQDKPRYQQWLAESLVESFGYDKAVKVCIKMCWFGTLDFLIKETNGHVAGASHQSTVLITAA